MIFDLKTRFCFVQRADHRANNSIIMCNIYTLVVVVFCHIFSNSFQPPEGAQVQRFIMQTRCSKSVREKKTTFKKSYQKHWPYIFDCILFLIKINQNNIAYNLGFITAQYVAQD